MLNPSPFTDYAAQVDFDGIPDAAVTADMAPGPTVQIDYTEKLLIGKSTFLQSSPARTNPVLTSPLRRLSLV